MLGHKDGTAVLERLNGGFKGSDFLGNINDFLLIKADQRTVMRARESLFFAISSAIFIM